MYKYIFFIFFFSTSICSAQEKPGAHITSTTYEAENMETSGTIMGPKYTAFEIETESSGQRCIKLSSKDQYVEFTTT
ncbi:MAG: hypothetical protein M3R50_03080, partial [Bacteroidota bacterium]|nr:hypothetical protein [Bacteroidota bacterium]